MKRILVTMLMLAATMGCRRARRDNTQAQNAPGSAVAPGMPGPTGGPPPVLSGSCGAYQSCCSALAGMPNMAALSSSCGQVAQLSALGAQGDATCGMALAGLRQGLAAMPGGAPPACQAGVASATGMTGGPSVPMPPAVPGTAAAPGAVGSIAVGQVIQGVLQQGDTVVADEGGRLADDYAITLQANRAITIVTRGGASTQNPGSPLDVVTAVVCNGVQVARDDDAAGYPNSRIVFTPTRAGPCTIRVMGFAGDAGQYTLQTYEGALENQT